MSEDTILKTLNNGVSLHVSDIENHDDIAVIDRHLILEKMPFLYYPTNPVYLSVFRKRATNNLTRKRRRDARTPGYSDMGKLLKTCS